MDTSTSPSQLKTYLLLACVFALALGGSLAFVLTGTPQDRFAMVEEAEVRSQEILDGAGEQFFGAAYMNTPGSSEVRMNLMMSTMMRLNDGLDPGWVPGGGQGALRPLRQGMEQLAALAFAILFFFTPAYILLMNFSDGDRVKEKLKTHARITLTVVILLYTYGWIDAAIFRGMTVPVMTSFSEGSIVRTTLHSLGFSGEGDVSPLEVLRGYHANHQSCELQIYTMVYESGGMFEGEGLRQTDVPCLTDESIPEAQRAMHRRAFIDAMAANPEELRAIIETMDTTNPDLRNALNDPTGSGQYDVNALMDDLGPVEGNALTRMAAETARAALASMMESVVRHVTGAIITAVNFVVTLILLFYSIGLFVARWMLLLIAPIAIVAMMFPGGEKIGRGWFKALVQVNLRIQITFFAALVMMAIVVGIMTADLGIPVLGTIMKIFLSLAIPFAIIKSNGIAKIAEGDLSTAALNVGSQVQGLAVKGVAATAGLAVAGAGGLVAGAAAGGAAGGAGAKALSAGGKGLQMLGNAGNALKIPGAEKLTGFGSKLVTRAVTGPDPMTAPFQFGGKLTESSAGKMAGATWNATKKTAGAAYDSWNKSSTSGLESAKMVGKEVMNAFPAVAEGVRAKRKKVAEEGAARAAPSTQRVVADEIPKGREARERAAVALGMDRPVARKGENVKVDETKIELAGSKAEIQVGRVIGGELITKAISQGARFNLTEAQDDKGRPVFTPDTKTVDSLNDLLTRDASFRKATWKVAAKRFGGEDQVPTRETAAGKVPDVAKLMQKDSGFLNGVMAASQYGEMVDQELFRRAVISHRVPAPKGSVFESVTRELDPQITTQQPSESDRDYERRIRKEVMAVLKEASYRELAQANPQALQARGIPADLTDSRAIRTHQNFKAVPVPTDWVHTEDSFAALDTASQSVVVSSRQQREAHVGQMQKRTVVSGGRPLGLDVTVFLKGDGTQYKAEDGSVFEQVVRNPQLAGDHAKAIEAAITTALADPKFNLPSKQKNETVQDYYDRNTAAVNQAIFLSATNVAKRRSALGQGEKSGQVE